MSHRRDKVKEQLIPIICVCGGSSSKDSCDGCIWWKSHKCCNPKVDRILTTIPGLAVVDRDAELPEIPTFLYDKEEDRALLRRGALNYSKMLSG